jgi:hypothetical protein
MEEFVVCLAIGAILYGACLALEHMLGRLASAVHNFKVRRADRILRKKQQRIDDLRELAIRNADLESQRITSRTEAERRKRVHALALKLQQALREVPSSRDFRRPASIAALCREVPVGFRQMQYKRYKSIIEEHAAVCLQQRINRTLLTNSLADLLQSLGIARFEAEYVIEAAAKKLKDEIAPHRDRDFGRVLQDELRLHRQRVKAIESLKDQPETIEQMLEIEHRRHEEALVRLTVGRRPDNSVTTL